ncbi:MAG TPA: Ig-like domain-containing protein [Nevskiaceae bacterium]|nr:Ig-like domain-containing protein [Nevskiaceae bacterium]
MRLLGSLLLGLGALGLVGCGDGSVQSPDFTSELVSITVTPATAELDEGETVQFTAVGNYSTPPGSESPTVEREIEGVSWSSSNNSIVSIDENGVATGVGNGEVTITARKSGKEGEATVSAFAATLQSIEVTPASATQPAGIAQQFEATGTFDTREGGTTTRNITDEVEWTVSAGGGANPIATIDASSGVATGLRVGTATIQAALDDQTDTAEFIVTPPVLVSLDVTPDDPSVPLGTVVTFRAIGVYSNGTTQPLEATWTSQTPAVATVAPASGATTDATTLTEGTTRIIATADNPDSETDLQGESLLTVTAAALQNFVRVEPELGRVTVGRRIEFRAIGRFSDGSEQQIPDSDVTWSIANAQGPADPAVATINNNGVATGQVIGVATVTATLNDPGSVTGAATRNARLTVTDSVCTTPLLASDGAEAVAEYSPTCPEGACLVSNPENVIDGIPDNFGTIAVNLGLLGGNASIRVDTAENGSYALPFEGGNNAGFVIAKPAGTLVLAELFSQVQVSTLLDGVEQEQTGNINPLRVELLGQEVIDGDLFDAALVSIATANDYDAIRLTFNSGTVTALSNVLVSQACGTLDLPPPASTLVNLERIVPASPTVLAGASVGLVAIGSYTDAEGSPTIEGPIPDADIDWSSEEEDVATIDANGLATGVAEGDSMITAALKDGVAATGDRDATTVLTVLPSACVTDFLASEGATAVGSTDGLCLLCSVTEPTNVIDDSLTTAARLGVNIGLLMGSVSLTVTQDPDADPQPSGQPTGFLIGRPTGTVALAEVLSAIQVSALREGVVVASSGPSIPLRLDLLGTEVVAMEDFGLVTIQPAAEYDAIRLTFNVGLLSVGLQNEVTNVKAFQACSRANVPVVEGKRKSIIPYRLK